MKTRKFVSTFFIIIMVLSLTPLQITAVGVFDGAIKMEALEFYQMNLKKDEPKYYKVTLPNDGTITFRYSNISTTDGSIGLSDTAFLLNSNAEKISDKWFIQYNEYEVANLKAGTYYLKINITTGTATINDFYYTFSSDEKPTVVIKMSVKAGTEIQLGTTTTNYYGKVKWTTTKKEVATVSNKGVVTTHKKGTVTIRVTLEDGTCDEIKISVI